MQFQINIAIDGPGLTQINGAGQVVTFVRFVNSFAMTLVASSAAVSTYAVAWLAFQPFENNVITWTDACELFTSTTVAQTNNVITVNSHTAGAQAGQTWTLQNGKFSLTSTGTGSAYLASNQAHNGLAFGLLAAANVNGTAATAPLNLMQVLFNQTGQFTPGETVTIFLSSAGANGTVIPAGSAGLTVTPTNGTPVNVAFNDATNQFYLSG